MTVFRKGLIEKELASFEPGKFQEFMLKFLPLYEPKYGGIIVNGGTIYGKTRLGTPDLIKTLSDGKQIVCECGTEQNYWNFSHASLDLQTCKSIKDAIKCIKSVAKLEEVILASSSSIPPSRGTAKSSIISYLKTKTKAQITILSARDIASWLDSNSEKKSVRCIIEYFFNEAAENITLRRKNKKLEEGLKLIGKYFPIDLIVGELLRKFGDDTDYKTLECELFEVENFSVEIPKKFDGIKRYDKYLSSKDHLLKGVTELTGVPLIGKTTLCIEKIITENMPYRWLDTPVIEDEHRKFIDHMKYVILSFFTSKEEALIQANNGIFDLSELESTATNQKLLIVIDNAHLLSGSYLKEINPIIKKIKNNSSLKSSLSIIFITNKQIKTIVSGIDKLIVAPQWSEDELEKLLAQKKVFIGDERKGEYLNYLHDFSGGHPMWALALARKYPSRKSLISQAIKRPNILDKELPNEIQEILYEVLESSDQQNFVQRLSMLYHRADVDLMDSLRTKIIPNIKYSVHNLYRQIGPAIIDGNPDQGLEINHSFKAVAKKRISKSEIELVYKLASENLFRVKSDCKIYADKYLMGIEYASKAHQFEKAIGSAIFLLNRIYRSENLNKDQLGFFLKRVDIFIHMSLKNLESNNSELELLMRYYMAQGYLILNDREKASRYLCPISIQRIADAATKNDDGATQKFIFVIRSIQMLMLDYSENPNYIIKNYMEMLDAQSIPSPQKILQAFHIPFAQMTIEKLRTLDFSFIMSSLYKHRANGMFSFASSIGSLAAKDESVHTLLISKDENKMLLTDKVFNFLFEMVSLSNSEKDSRALEAAINARNILQENGDNDSILGPEFFHILGNIYFNIGRKKKALENFQVSNKLFNSCDVGYSLEGVNYLKMGFSSSSPREIVKHLRKSIEINSKDGYFEDVGRALGALGIFYLENGNYKKVIDISGELIDLYYTAKKHKVRACLRVLFGKLYIYSEYAFRLSEEELQKADNIKFESFLNIVRTDVIRYGIGSCFKILGDFAKKHISASNARELYKKCINLNAQDKSEKNKIDCDILLDAWEGFFALSTFQDFKESELRELFTDIIKGYSIQHNQYDRFFWDKIFKIFEDRAQENSYKWGPVLLKLIDIVREELGEVSNEIIPNWDLMIKLQEGRAQYFIGNKRDAFTRLKEVSACAERSQGWDIVCNTQFILSFSLEEFHTVETFGESCYKLLLSIEKSKASDEALGNFGTNLFKICSNLNYKSIRASELKINEYLLKGAKVLLQNNFSEEKAAPVMISLLADLYQHSERYQDKLDPLMKLPEEIEHILEVKPRDDNAQRE